MPRITLYRTPRMEAVSGAWLEALSKSEAQTFIYVLPWFFLSACFVGTATLTYIQCKLSNSPTDEAMLVVYKILYFVCFVLCAAYLVFAIFFEPFSCCFLGSKACRSREGWCSLVLVAICLLSSFLFFLSLQETHAFQFIDGTVKFGIASTLDFIMQLSWLAAAHHIRYTKRTMPRWKVYGGSLFFLLILSWPLLTYFNEVLHTGKELHTAFVWIGYSARWSVFTYCVLHTLKKLTRFCCHCFPVADWQDLERVPCTPGNQRLRHLTYYVLTRPSCLLAISLPLGYPLDLGCAFASTLRCGFALLLAVVLGPALGSGAFEMHDPERETRDRFSIDLALRLWEYSKETYLVSSPLPKSVKISGCTSEWMDGEYSRDFSCNNPTYTRTIRRAAIAGEANPFENDIAADEGAGEITLFLRRTPEDEWEISKSPSYEPDCREAFVLDEAFVAPSSPMLGDWTEGSSQQANPKLKVNVSHSCCYHKRRFEHSGVSPTRDRWILVEEDGALATEESDVISIVVAFRGTENLQNLGTDARISMRPLVESTSDNQSEVEPLDYFQLKRRLLQVQEQMLPIAQDMSMHTLPHDRVTSDSNSDTGNPFADLEVSLTRSNDSDIQDNEDAPGERFSLWRCLRNCFCFPFYCFWRSCIWFFFPFLSPSDVEEDDEEFGVDLLPKLLIHTGFSSGYSAMRSEILALVRTRLKIARDEGRYAQVFITGHSLGGALATLFALDFVSSVLPGNILDGEWTGGSIDINKLIWSDGTQTTINIVTSNQFTTTIDEVEMKAVLKDDGKLYWNDGRIWERESGGRVRTLSMSSDPMVDSRNFLGTRPIVYTFGCPRLGNAAFRSTYNVLVPETFRVVASRDLVSSVPPGNAYRHVGREVWLDDAGELTYAMSWAMRQILPARNTLQHHALNEYYRRLTKAFIRLKSYPFISVFDGEAFMVGASDSWI